MSFGLSVPAVGVTFELIDKNVSHYLPFVRTCCRSRFQSSLTRTCLTIFHYRHPLSDLLSTLTDEENMSHEIPIHRRHPLMRYEKKQVSDELPFVGARCRSCFRSSLMRRCLTIFRWSWFRRSLMRRCLMSFRSLALAVGVVFEAH